MRPIVIRCLVVLAAAGTLAFVPSVAPAAQDPAPGGQGGDRVAALEAEVATLKLEIERLTAESEVTAVKAAQLEAGLASVAQAADALSRVLDRSEQQGFTAGINYESRVTLLAGWRRYLSTVSSAAPQPAPPGAENDR